MKVYVVERSPNYEESYEGIYATLEAAKKSHKGDWRGPFDHKRYTASDTEIVEMFDRRCWDHATERASIYEEELRT